MFVEIFFRDISMLLFKYTENPYKKEQQHSIKRGSILPDVGIFHCYTLKPFIFNHVERKCPWTKGQKAGSLYISFMFFMISTHCLLQFKEVEVNKEKKKVTCQSALFFSFFFGKQEITFLLLTLVTEKTEKLFCSNSVCLSSYW